MPSIQTIVDIQHVRAECADSLLLRHTQINREMDFMLNVDLFIMMLFQQWPHLSLVT